MVYILKLNGVAVAAPLPYEVIIQDVDGKTERNANARIIRDRIAAKRSIPLEWGVLNGQEVQEILTAVSGVEFPVAYDDPELGQTTKVFYAGNRKSPKLIDAGNEKYYKGLSFTVVEC